MTVDNSTAPTARKTRVQSPLKGPVQEQVANILTAMISYKGWQFFASEEEISADKVAGPLQMLPALMWQVEKMYRVAYGGVSTGLLYEGNDKGVLGASVVFPEGRPRSPLLLFAQEALQRAQESYPVPGSDGASLDHMVQEFMDDRDAGLIPWVQPPKDPKPAQSSPQAAI